MLLTISKTSDVELLVMVVASAILIVPEVPVLIVLTSAAVNVVSESVTSQLLSKPIAEMLLTIVLTAAAVLLVIVVMVPALIATDVLPSNVFKSAADAVVASSTKVRASLLLPALDKPALRAATTPVAVTVAVTAPVVLPRIVFALATDEVPDIAAM